MKAQLVGPSSLKAQLFLSQNLHSLYKSPSHTTSDAHFSWASLFKAPYGAPRTTLIVIHIEMVPNSVSSSLTHLAFAVRVGRLPPSLTSATGSSPTHLSPAKLWSFANKYYHIPAQWRRLLDRHFVAVLLSTWKTDCMCTWRISLSPVILQN